jgi:hypothetical protein
MLHFPFFKFAIIRPQYALSLSILATHTPSLLLIEDAFMAYKGLQQPVFYAEHRRLGGYRNMGVPPFLKRGGPLKPKILINPAPPPTLFKLSRAKFACLPREGIWQSHKPLCNQSSMQSIEDQPLFKRLQRGWSYMVLTGGRAINAYTQGATQSSMLCIENKGLQQPLCNQSSMQSIEDQPVLYGINCGQSHKRIHPRGHPVFYAKHRIE